MDLGKHRLASATSALPSALIPHLLGAGTIPQFRAPGQAWPLSGPCGPAQDLHDRLLPPHDGNKHPGQRLAEAGPPDGEESVRLAPGSSVDAQLTLVGKKAASRCTPKQPGRSDIQSESKIGRPTGSPQRVPIRPGLQPGLGSDPATCPSRGVDIGPLLPAPGLTSHLLTMMALTTRPPGISQGPGSKAHPHPRLTHTHSNQE